MLLLPTSVLHPSPRKSLAEEELRQKLKIEEGGKKEQGRKGGRLEGLGKSRMARVKKFVLVVDSLFEVPKSKLGSLDRDIIAWFRENYGILEPNEDKYGKNSVSECFKSWRRYSKRNSLAALSLSAWVTISSQ